MERNSQKKNVTIYDIAREVGVSPSLVSRVLSGNGSVSKKNREKIEGVIEKYEYRPNAMARGLQKSKTGMIGFIVPHVGNEYFSSVYYEFEKNASKNGYMTILYNGKSNLETEMRILRVLEEARVEAVIYMGGQVDNMHPPENFLQSVRKLNETIPCVLCSEQAGRFGCVGVHSDDAEGSRRLLEYLYGKQYKTMGILGGTCTVYPSTKRRQNLNNNAKLHGIEIREEWIVGNSFDEIDGAVSMQKLLKQKELPEVVCCINDHVAFGAQIVALDAGLKIPDDIAFTGFDGVRTSIMARPELTTVATDFTAMGLNIFQVMMSRLSSERCELLTLVEPKLVVRKSSR